MEYFDLWDSRMIKSLILPKSGNQLRFLIQRVPSRRISNALSIPLSHSLELPLHWRVPWVEAKWFMEVYEKRSGMNPKLMEFSKLNFDMVQAIHIEDLKDASRWWRNIRWDEILTFSRDRLVEHFMWSTGFGHLPEFSLGRRTLTKVNSMITAIDDVYDVYGTLDELEQFTDVISRWEIKMVEDLPDYMKICFLGFYNTINEIAYNTLTNTGFLVLPYLTKAWAGLCKAYLEEARWYYAGYTPTLQEYLDNAYESISGPVILMHVNFLTTADDLGTSSDELARGDTSKSIQCYMHERGATEDEARTYIKNLIMETWKKLNKERASANSQFSQEFFDHATNIPRMAQFMYSTGDGHGRPDLIKGHVLSLLFKPTITELETASSSYNSLYNHQPTQNIWAVAENYRFEPAFVESRKLVSEIGDMMSVQVIIKRGIHSRHGCTLHYRVKNGETTSTFYSFSGVTDEVKAFLSDVLKSTLQKGSKIEAEARYSFVEGSRDVVVLDAMLESRIKQ
nr:R-linalool synthase QH1, chloroplastic-like [Tanacetum cinerariifolium]